MIDKLGGAKKKGEKFIKLEEFYPIYSDARKREMPVLVTSQSAAPAPPLSPSTPPQFRMPSFWVFSSLYSELLSCPSSESLWEKKKKLVTDTDTSSQPMLTMNRPRTTAMLRGRSIQLAQF